MLQSIDHSNIVVADMPTMIVFYRDVQTMCGISKTLTYLFLAV